MTTRIFLWRTWAIFFCLLQVGGLAWGEIPKPTDAPPALSPEDSRKCFSVPDGFRVELVAAEPLIREPSGVCWDARGRLYVSELHGYNLEGQYDIDELNKSGELDRVVRRIPANPAAVQAAKAGTYGTVKLLSDTDGDGAMDRATVFADKLPPCYGVCPARDGIIAVGAPEIIFLADRDGDGRAEVRDVLYTGFPAGALERGINCPQWGLDDWIYVGAGHSGGTITGPALKHAVNLPTTDFRIKADGSAIEPITGRTQTIGFAFTERGERVVVSTGSPGILVAPLPSRYLERNPDYAPGSLQSSLGDHRTYPTSRPHPWRTRRADNPGFVKFYGTDETAPNGYFTSACSPLVYQDSSLPGLNGQLLTCEPAQNMVHRASITRDGTALQLHRCKGEEQSEFLASTDPWFHPIALAHAPDGSVYLADFYREIIEDYSAIPRYLQQQYGLVHGKDHGRIWRLTHRDSPAGPPADMSALTPEQLVDELASPHFWRRQTASRLLSDRKPDATATAIARQITDAESSAAVINALYALAALDGLTPPVLLTALASADAGVRIHALRLAEPWLDRDTQVLQRVLTMADDPDAAVVLQVALSLGESTDPRAMQALVEIARKHADALWMDAAILSGLSGRAGEMLTELLGNIDTLAEARRLLKPLAAAVAARRDPRELSDTLTLLSRVQDLGVRQICWQGLRSGFSGPAHVALDDAAIAALKGTAADADPVVGKLGKELVRILYLETADQRRARIDATLATVSDIQATVEARLAAVSEIATEDDANVTQALLAAVGVSTPRVRDAILGAIFTRQNRLPSVVAALESGVLPASALTALQQSTLLNHADAKLRDRAKAKLQVSDAGLDESLARYAAALSGKRDPAHGAVLFREKCGICHQARGVGVAVGPDLGAEAQRSEETILRDILAPSSALTAGYVTYLVVNNDGQVFSGLLTEETANSVTLKQAEGKFQTILRKDIDELKASDVSLMPADLAKTVSPQDAADILAWIRNAP